MNLALRLLLLDHDDGIYRLPHAVFDRMRQDPTRHRLPQFAGQRVRTAEMAIELLNRKAVRVVQAPSAS